MSNEWQDISTAPRDGTSIDLWHKEYGRQTDHYWGMPSHECGEMGQYCDSDWHRAEMGWVDATFNEFAFDPDGFTHFMHLPNPPKQEA